MKKTLPLFLLPLLFALPNLLQAQSCPTSKSANLRVTPRFVSVPMNSHMLHPLNPYYERDFTGMATPSQQYKIYVLERIGDCYKIANSDLGRTMKVRSDHFALVTGEHYDLRLRKIRPVEGEEGEAPGKKDCEPEWEVVSGQSR